MAKAIAPLAFTSFASGEFFHTKFSQVQFHCLCTEISFCSRLYKLASSQIFYFAQFILKALVCWNRPSKVFFDPSQSESNFMTFNSMLKLFCFYSSHSLTSTNLINQPFEIFLFKVFVCVLAEKTCLYPDFYHSQSSTVLTLQFSPLFFFFQQKTLVVLHWLTAKVCNTKQQTLG